MKEQIRIAAVMTVSALALAVASPSVFAADDEGPKETGKEYVETSPRPGIQENLEKVAQDIVDSRPNEGFGGTAINIDDNAVDVWWKGEVPSGLQAIAREAKPVDVRFITAEFTQSQLEEAATRIHKNKKSSGIAVQSVVLESLDQPTPVHGLRVIVKGDAGKTSEAARADAARELSDVAGIPVAIDMGPPRQLLSRTVDSNPWYGGGLMLHTGPTQIDVCSTGFGTRKTNGSTRLLSAGHCDPNGNMTWKNGDLSTVLSNPPNDYRWGLDSLVIDPNDTTVGRVFGGPWNASTTHARYSLKVAGKNANQMGSDVCGSGSIAGEHCMTTNAHVLGPCGTSACDVWYAQSGSTPSGATGDSGGPVYAQRSDGRVNARGIIYDGGVAVPCGSVRVGTECSASVGFMDITDVLNTWDLTILTLS